VQAGLGRTGHVLATRAAGVDADVYLLGKALGAGIVPVSAVVADSDVLGVLKPGQHGSTFGGNPLACAVGRAVVALLAEGSLLEHTRAMGEVLHEGLRELLGHGATAVRGVGLWAGVDVDPELGTGREVCERLAALGVLAKDTHGPTVRLSPPLVITEPELHTALTALRHALRS
jgi:ornithine--oxo-acid transaminase